MPDTPAPGGDAGTLAVLQAMVRTFTDMLDSMDRRLGTMEDAMRALQVDQAAVSQLRGALNQLGRVEAIEAELSAIRAALLDHPAVGIYDAVGRLTAKVDSLVAQPGPGPAMAMVAAGLSERFEQRTDGLVELLQEHAELMRSLAEEIQRAMQGLVVAVEGRQAGLDALLDTVRAAASTIEGMRARVEEARDRVDDVFRASEDLPAAVESLRVLEDAIRGAAEMIEHQSVDALADVVHEESEMLAQRLAAISSSVDAVERLVAAHAEESSHSLGRRASEAGRRLAADLGLAGGKARERPTAPSPPPPPRRRKR